MTQHQRVTFHRTMDRMETTEQLLGGLTSIYLEKGRFWSKRGYGVYATADRIIGVRLGLRYLVLFQAPAIVAVPVAVALFFGYWPTSTESPLFLLLLLLPFIVTILNGFLIPSVVEGRLEDKDPKNIEEVEGRKYFELRREDISEVELKRPGGLTAGYVLFKLKKGEAVKIRVVSALNGNEHRLFKINRLIQSFAGKEPLIRSLGLAVWTL